MNRQVDMSNKKRPSIIPPAIVDQQFKIIPHGWLAATEFIDGMVIYEQIIFSSDEQSWLYSSRSPSYFIGTANKPGLYPFVLLERLQSPADSRDIMACHQQSSWYRYGVKTLDGQVLMYKNSEQSDRYYQDCFILSSSILRQPELPLVDKIYANIFTQTLQWSDPSVITECRVINDLINQLHLDYDAIKQRCSDEKHALFSMSDRIELARIGLQILVINNHCRLESQVVLDRSEIDYIFETLNLLEFMYEKLTRLYRHNHQTFASDFISLINAMCKIHAPITLSPNYQQYALRYQKMREEVSACCEMISSIDFSLSLFTPIKSSVEHSLRALESLNFTGDPGLTLHRSRADEWYRSALMDLILAYATDTIDPGSAAIMSRRAIDGFSDHLADGEFIGWMIEAEKDPEVVDFLKVMYQSICCSYAVDLNHCRDVVSLPIMKNLDA